MESAALCSSSSSSSSLVDCLKPRAKVSQLKRVSPGRPNKVVYACSNHHHNHNRSHRLVDENMIVLRKRIHEMKMMERNYEPPENWMEWEKHCYTGYDSLICEAMGVLQTQLMNTRPSLALGMTALILLSVPTSTALVCSHLMEITKGILAGIHML